MSWQLTERERAALTVEMRRIGSLGGQATARNMSEQARRERALKGVKTKAAKLLKQASRASVAVQEMNQ